MHTREMRVCVFLYHVKLLCNRKVWRINFVLRLKFTKSYVVNYSTKRLTAVIFPNPLKLLVLKVHMVIYL